MARTNHTPRSRSPWSSFKLRNKSPLHYNIKRISGDFKRRSAPRPSTNRTRVLPTGHLQPIREEESPSPVRRRARNTSHGYQNFDINDDTLYDNAEFDDGGFDYANKRKLASEDSFFHWEEESTLFSDLLEEAPEQCKDQTVESLVNSLQTSFDMGGKELKKEIAQTLVPTVNHVKALYQVLDEEVDVSFAKGIVTFNNACKETEALAIKEQDDLNRAFMTTQGKIEELLTQLKEAYAHRDRLWVDFEKALDETATSTLESLKQAPGKMERTIANLERQAKVLEKDDSGSASAAQKKFKGILSKLT